MADAASKEPAVRRERLAGLSTTREHVSVTPGPPAARLALRAGDDALNSVSRALGVSVPRKPKTSARAKSGG
ncbi:MAG: sarcosine oxidase subunit gamma, partial [Nitratireductor sp.]